MSDWKPGDRWGGGCTCFVADPKTWTTHYGAVEPGSQLEPDYDCPEHFPRIEHQPSEEMA